MEAKQFESLLNDINTFGIDQFSAAVHEEPSVITNKLQKRRLTPQQFKAWVAVLEKLQSNQKIDTVVVKHEPKGKPNHYEKVYGFITSIVGRRINMITVLQKKRHVNMSKVNRVFS